MQDGDVPEHLGHFEISREIGRGGMGVVYLARDTKLDREVAIKALPERLIEDRDRLARFVREAKTLASLNHPGIASIYGLEELADKRYLVLEYVSGEPLSQVLRRGPLLPDEALALAGQLALAIEYAHERGIVHRDLKPANVMVTQSGGIKVLDFGLAKALQGPESGAADPAASPTPSAVTPTQAGVVLGTPGYLSPEQARGRPADRRADVFSFGCILYQMLTGRTPFPGDTFAEVLAATLKDEPDLASLPAGVPAAVRAMLRLSLAKDPSRRLQHIGDCRVLLEDAGGAGREDRPTVVSAAGIEPVLERFRIGEEICRKLDRARLDPRLIGYELQYLDNHHPSDVLVFFIHAVGRDHEQWREHLRSVPYRGIAPTQIGFEPDTDIRPRLSIRDHFVVLREFIRAMVAHYKPHATLLTAHSAGADLAMRMISAFEETDALPIDGLLPLEPNLALETCQVTGQLAQFEPGNDRQLLDRLNEFSRVPESLDDWVILYDYIVGIISKFRHDIETLRDFAREIVEPFRTAGPSPFLEWYRGVTARVPCVRCVFSETPVYNERILKLRLDHLDDGCFGEHHREEAIRIERGTTHLDLYHVPRVSQYLREMLQEISGSRPRLRRDPEALRPDHT